MELFQGFDTFSGETRNKVVTGTVEAAATEINAAEIMVCTDRETLDKALQIDASVSVSYGAFAADAKSHYVQDLHLTTNAVVVVLRASKTTKTTFTNAFLPTEVTDPLAIPAKVREFVHQNGDSFVREIVTGSAYFATFTFMSETEKEKTDIVNSLSSSYGLGDDKAAGSVAVNLSTALSSAKVRYDIHHMVIGVHDVKPPTYGSSVAEINNMVEFAIGFSELPADQAETVSFRVDPYEQLLPESVSERFSGVTKNRRAFLGGHAVTGWGQMIVQLTGVRNDCETIMNLFSLYGDLKDPNFDTQYRQVLQDLRHLDDHADTVRNDPTTEAAAPAPKSFSWGIPDPNFTVIVPVKRNFLNVGGGGFFEDVTLDQISQGVHLDKVTVRSSTGGDRIFQVSATYSTKFPTEKVFTLVHGGEDGSLLPTLGLGSKEFITSMAGWTGHHRYGSGDYMMVTGLVFDTSNGQKWSTDSDHTPTDKWPDPDQPTSDVFIGFCGSATGDGVECIQPLVLRFKRVEWTRAMTKPAS